MSPCFAVSIQKFIVLILWSSNLSLELTLSWKIMSFLFEYFYFHLYNRAFAYKKGVYEERRLGHEQASLPRKSIQRKPFFFLGIATLKSVCNLSQIIKISRTFDGVKPSLPQLKFLSFEITLQPDGDLQLLFFLFLVGFWMIVILGLVFWYLYCIQSSYWLMLFHIDV